jgi:FkbM family methyltransferase
MPRRASFRARLRDALAVRPAVCRSLGAVAARLGAASLGAKLRQLGVDLVVVEVPAAAVGRPGVVVKLPGRVGRDQIATALRDGGWPAFEPPMPTLFAACVTTFPGVVYDIGANTGFYSVIAAAAHADNTIVAFEPFPPVCDDLVSTLRVNRCSARVRVEPVAVGSTPGEATLYIPLQDHGLVETSASLSAKFKETHGEAIAVQVVALDAYDASQQPGPATVLKIDVESLEAEVLRGAQQLMRTHRPLVFFEVLPSGDVESIERIRQETNYVDMRLHRDEVIVGQAVSFDPDGWNHLLVPAEKLRAVEDLITRCGLRLTAAEV